MLTVACVKWGDKYPPEYVHKLRDGVSRHLSIPHRFVCFTDDPAGLECDTEILPEGLKGWWNKLYLFRRDLFEGRMLYFDLDMVIVGNLDEVAEWPEPFGIIGDWHYAAFNSSCFVLDANTHVEVWEDFGEEVAGRLHGDQDWITEKVKAKTFPPEWFSSYRSHSTAYPYGKAVVFHGRPNPHEVGEGWVPAYWRIGGPTEDEVTEVAESYGLRPMSVSVTCNTGDETVLGQVRRNMERDIPWIRSVKEHKGKVAIVGGGPSLQRQLPLLRKKISRGFKVWALNGAHDYLMERGIIPDAMVMLDARDHNVKFVRNPNKCVEYLLASQVHPDVFEALEGQNVTLWHTWAQGIQEVLEKETERPVGIIGGGGTVGLRSMYLAHILGFRHLELFGIDSSLEKGEGYSYAQELASVQVFTVNVKGKLFEVIPTLAKQADEFQRQYFQLKAQGTTVKAHGDGLIPWIAKHLNDHKQAA